MLSAPEGFRPGPRHLALVGPTASGKSALAMAVARRHPDVEIVTVDSMQVYRGMDIGTAKPTRAEQAEVRHHLLDLVEPWEDYTLSRYQADALGVLADLERRGRRGLLVGGTGLYLQSVTDTLEIPGRFPDVRAELEREPDTSVLYRRLVALDSLAAQRMQPGNRRRVVRALEVTIGADRPFSSFGPGLDAYPPAPFPVVGLRLPRPLLDDRIRERYAEQVAGGFVAEVRRLLARSEGLSRTARQALGYAELIEHVEQGVPLDVAVERAVTRTRRFARRQQRWFGRDPRLMWVDIGATDDPADPIGTLDSGAVENALVAIDEILRD
jgi:tRNA dimethylallyltransferase